MEFNKDTLRTVVFIIILVVSVGQLLLKKLRSKKRSDEETGSSTEAPGEEEPKLPYEDLAEQVLGPYMERRRKEYEASRRITHPSESPAEESPLPEPPALPKRPPGPRPRSLEEREAGIQVLKPSVPSPTQAAPAVSAAPENPLEVRLFGNRAFGSGAKLILASEIMRRPRFLRGAARR